MRNTTWLQFLQIFYKQYEMVTHILITSFLCLLGKISFSETFDYCASECDLTNIHTVSKLLSCTTPSLPKSMSLSWCLTTNEILMLVLLPDWLIGLFMYY